MYNYKYVLWTETWYLLHSRVHNDSTVHIIKIIIRDVKFVFFQIRTLFVKFEFYSNFV